MLSMSFDPLCILSGTCSVLNKQQARTEVDSRPILGLMRVLY